MSDPVGISLEKIRDFMLSKGGKVTNHELVKHFKDALTNENTRDEARILFKELINTVATITKDADGRKQLVLKKKYRTPTPSATAAVNALDNPIYTGITLPTLSMSPETPLNLRYTPVYQTSHDTSPIGDSLGSPLSLKSAPSFTSDSPIPSSVYSGRRVSQDSLLSQLSLRTALSTATSSTSASSVSSSVPSTSNSVYSVNSGNTSSTSTLSNTSSSSSSSAIPTSSQRVGSTLSSSSPAVSATSSLIFSTSSTDRTPTTPTSLTHREMSDESMYSTFSEIYPPTSSTTKDSTDPPPPPVPPRRKSSDKIRLELRESNDEIKQSTCSATGQTVSSDGSSVNNPVITTDLDNKENVGNVSKISVKERSQKFDRMASESALNKLVLPNNANGNNNKKKHDKTDKDEEDSGSVQLMDGKCREWLVRCAQGDYQTIVKLAAENPKLVKFKDPTNGYTALHWGAKHGNLDIIKLIAGTHKADVNSRTNGGYTALHLAIQFGHEEVATQLIKVYKADENIRDYSGRKPRQYQKTSGTSISADTFRKIKARKKHAAEKDLRFLRIGSLNVRVKRTTEAFSNFLGVGNADKLHKHWGSADNLPQGDHKRMPPPKFAPIKKRKSKRGQDFNIKPTAVEQHPAAPLSEQNPQDSDSDTAAGFGSTWQSTV